MIQNQVGMLIVPSIMTEGRNNGWEGARKAARKGIRRKQGKEKRKKEGQ